MVRVLNSFKIRSGGRFLDYRLGEDLDLQKIKFFFQDKYQIKKIWKGSRHVLGILAKNNVDYFLKLSSSEGISVVTQNEYAWNDYFNKYFPSELPYRVPKNSDSGFYQQKYYLITEYLAGGLLCDIGKDASCLREYKLQVIELSEAIQQLPKRDFTNGNNKEVNYQLKFLNKTRNWFSDIPGSVSQKFNIKTLLKLVENGVSELSIKPRHGDFTPWHIIRLPNKKLGLIDGEHVDPGGIENYDICYLIQRVFSVLKSPGIAQDIYLRLLEKGYEKNKLKTVLAARAIGGFLDESLTDKPNYMFASNFTDWIIKLS